MKNKHFIILLFLFASLGCYAQKKTILTDVIKTTTEFWLNGQKVTLIMTDTALIGATHNAIPTAKAVKDFVLNNSGGGGGGGGGGDDWGDQVVSTGANLTGDGTPGDPLDWAGASVTGPITGSGTALSPLNILNSSINATHIATGGVDLSTADVTGVNPVSKGGSGASTLTGYLKGNGTSPFTASALIPEADIQNDNILARISGNETISGAWTFIGNTVFRDNNFSITDDGDNSKIAKFQASGIATGTTRTYTLPNANGTLALTSDAAGGDLSGTLSNLQLGAGVVGSTELADNAVTNAKLADNAVNTAELADDAVTMAKIAQAGASSGQVIKWNGTDWAPAADAAGGGGANWGDIGGTLSAQTDLQTALDGKVDENTPITGSTKTKVTYDSKGLVTSGADATTSDIAEGSNLYYQDERVDDRVNALVIAGNGLQKTYNDGANTYELAVTAAVLTTASTAGGDLSGTLSNLQLGAGVVGSTELADNSVTNAKLGDNAVNTAELADDAVTMAKIAQAGASSGQVIKWNGTDWAPAADAAGGGGANWGDIGGTLSAQTDLQTALDGKVDENTPITGATKTKVSYDSKGLVTSGADATTSDIAEGSNLYYNDERVDDRVNALIVPGTGIQKTYNDVANSYELAVSADVLTTSSASGGDLSGPLSNLQIGANTVTATELANGAVDLSTADVTGVNPVSKGGSGASTLNGYLKGNGTSPFTAAATIPETDIADGTLLARVGSAETISGNWTYTGTGNRFRDNAFTLSDNGDNTKLATFEASSISTATTRTYTLPNVNGTLALTSDAAGGDLSGTLSNLQLGAGVVGSTELADNAVTNAKLADNAVNTAELADDAVTMAKIAQAGASSGQVIKWNGTDWAPAADAAGGGGANWGDIGGTLSAQTDLQTALDGKVDENTPITGATKTKVTYDAKGLVTSGADATTSDIGEGSNLYYLDERVDDRVNALIVPGTGIQKTYDDVANSYELAVTTAVLTTASTSGGDLSGPLSNLQIGANTVTATELANGAVDLSTADVTGVNPVSKGGSGASTLTGYLKGNGTSAFTGSSTIPETDIADGTIIARVGSAETISGNWTHTGTGNRFRDNAFTLSDNTDNTKLATFEASAISTATTRTYTLPNVNGTLALTSEIINDHGSMSGLGDDDHTQYALLLGRGTSQTLNGGTTSGGGLILNSTTNATKGSILLNPSGGDVHVGGGTAASTFFIYEPSGAGGNKIGLKAPATFGADYNLTLPTTDGDPDQVLKSDGSGGLSFATDNNGLLGGDGTFQAGTTNGVLPASAVIRFDFAGGNAGLEVNDGSSSSFLRSKNLQHYFTASNSAASLTGFNAGFSIYSAVSALSSQAQMTYNNVNTFGVSASGFTCTSTEEMFFPPIMNSTQEGAITPLANGGILYNNTTNKFRFRENGAWVELGGGGGGTWGSITGTLSDQTDLDDALADKQDFDAKINGFAFMDGTQGLIIDQGGGSYVKRTINGTTNKILINNGNGVSSNPTIDVGTDIVQLSSTQTLTNKEVVNRVTSTASSSTPTPNESTDDVYIVTALAVNATFGNPGTGLNGQTLLIRVKDNGTSRTLAWNAAYRFSTEIPAPAATVAGSTMYLAFLFNAEDNKWDCCGITKGF
jgi:hypothetical protein